MSTMFELDFAALPPKKPFQEGIRRAPSRGYRLNRKDTETALKNALRYIPKRFHEELAPEFMDELLTRGRIYGYRFRPEGRIYGRPIHEYPGKILDAKGMQVMIDNNLDFDVALYPYELVTYGETGQVCQNWMQYLLIKRYLSEMTDNQTLVVSSGHPLGLFPSRPEAPRAIITNGLMVGMFDTPEDFHRLAAMGCVNYGQMTAGRLDVHRPPGHRPRHLHHAPQRGPSVPGHPPGSGPARARLHHLGTGRHVGRPAQGRRHRRRRLRHRRGGPQPHPDAPLPGLGGQGLRRPARSLPLGATRPAPRPSPAPSPTTATSWTSWSTSTSKGIEAELISDQTSCHAVYEGGYCPAGLSYEQAKALLRDDFSTFKAKVDESLAAPLPGPQAPHRQGRAFLGLRQLLHEGRLRRGRQGHLQERPGHERRLHLAQLCRRHHGAPVLRLRLRALPVGLPFRASRRTWTPPTRRPPRASTRTAAGRTGTTTTGCATPRRTGSSWARRPASSTPTPRAA